MRWIVIAAIIWGTLVQLRPLQPGALSQNALTTIPLCASQPDDSSNYPHKMIRPKYPKDALRKGDSGTVELRAVITPYGKMKDLNVLSGKPEFSESAIDAVRKWRFHPKVQHGLPVETTFKIHVRFNPLLREANSDVELESPRTELSAAAPGITQLDFGPGVHHLSEPGVVAPEEIYAPEPEFSEESRKEKQHGTVGIALAVGTDGLPHDLRILCSSIPDSNEIAVNAIKKWRFVPAKKDGKPVPVAIEVDVSFYRYD
jgi:TonB family protein